LRKGGGFEGLRSEVRELKGKTSGLADYEARDRLATRRFWFPEEIERGIELTRTGF